MGLLTRMIEAWKAWRKRLEVPLKEGRIVLHRDGIAAEHPRRAPWRIAWSQVKEVVAWKRDLFSIDLIELGFRVDATGELYIVDEDQEGWSELLLVLPTVFPGLKEDWSARVAVPAFQTCWTNLWGEPLDESMYQFRR